jgi:hypothetical protein
MTLPIDSPFHPDNTDAYHRWRDEKLTGYPQRAEDLFVEFADPLRLSDAEYAAALALVRKANMAVYLTPRAGDPDKAIPRTIGARFGLQRLDHNFLADDDAVTSITVNPEGEHPSFIPYTNRSIKWHTDGYYTVGEEKVRAMVLHCVTNAVEGGENALLDHEIAYILIREHDPDMIRALMAPDVMTIPAREDDDGIARPEVTGPVFSLDKGGKLHMRYTARKRNIAWQDAPASRAAVAYLEQILDSDSPYVFRAKLPDGAGLLCNNVLHDRAGFTDTPGHKRLLYRARYFDRIAGS